MPNQLTELINDWKFFRYKINEGFVHGASLAVNISGTMSIEEYGLSQNNLGEEFEQFVHDKLNITTLIRFVADGIIWPWRKTATCI